MASKKAALRHAFIYLGLFIILAIFTFFAGGYGPGLTDSTNVVELYGKWPVIIMYVMRLLTLIPLPIVVSNFLGIVMYNPFPDKPTITASTLFGPFICFRVVTRGTFPELVKRNVKRNIQICEQMGLDNFVVEVVTDTAINLSTIQRTREVVVPSTYRSSNGSLYKARALHYCLEDGVNKLSEKDWIVHLDEETLLTESSLIGIVNFIHEGSCSFGQGVITYANEEIISWLTTLSDLVRVGADYGVLRFSLQYLHKPVFSWKGSFVVSNAAAEKAVGFDFGPEGSIAEDCFFALSAWRDGYKFGYIQGEMWEKSTFSVVDYIKQRKRWVQGISMTLMSKQIPTGKKFGIFTMVMAWLTMPFSVPNMVLMPLFPLPLPNIINFLCGFMGGVMTFLYILSAIKSLHVRRLGIVRYILLCAAPIVLIPVFVTMETCGVLSALFNRQKEFHIVNKEVPLSPLDRVINI